MTTAAVGLGIPMGIWDGYRSVGILWRFVNGCEIKRKRVKHEINIVVAV